jgi:hypothetical protein
MIVVEVWDPTGAKRREVEVPDDVPTGRILVLLVERMQMPREGPDGQMLSYKFHHRATGRQLLDEQTLHQAGVNSGDVLRLQPEITAGSIFHSPRRSPSAFDHASAIPATDR